MQTVPEGVEDSQMRIASAGFWVQRTWPEERCATGTAELSSQRCWSTRWSQPFSPGTTLDMLISFLVLKGVKTLFSNCSIKKSTSVTLPCRISLLWTNVWNQYDSKALHVVISGTKSAPPGAWRATKDHSVCLPLSSFRAFQLKHEVNTGQIAFNVFQWFPTESVAVCKQPPSERLLLPRVVRSDVHPLSLSSQLYLSNKFAPKETVMA